MSTRERCLPPGWYPAGEKQTAKEIEAFFVGLPARRSEAAAVIVPHAGWAFSGRTALAALRLLRPAETVAVVGGHLRPGDGVLAAPEDGYSTPLGILEADRELLEALGEKIPLQADLEPDNTVEIQLPLVRHLFPRARALWLRAAPDESSLGLGRALRDAAAGLGRNLAVAGSTDLTHYGPGYGFSPAGGGKEGRDWSRQNDLAFVRALLEMDGEGALRHARKNRSACSAGGAAAALEFARAEGMKRAELVEYADSYGVHPAADFVGYAGIAYSP